MLSNDILKQPIKCSIPFSFFLLTHFIFNDWFDTGLEWMIWHMRMTDWSLHWCSAFCAHLFHILNNSRFPPSLLSFSPPLLLSLPSLLPSLIQTINTLIKIKLHYNSRASAAQHDGNEYCRLSREHLRMALNMNIGSQRRWKKEQKKFKRQTTISLQKWRCIWGKCSMSGTSVTCLKDVSLRLIRQ